MPCRPAFRQMQLAYLGCASYAHCPQALAASPLYWVDESDPPFFVCHSLDDPMRLQIADWLRDKLEP